MSRDQGTRRARVMFVIDFIYGLTGGTENQIAKLINGLNQENFELYLLCLHNTPWLSDNRGNLKCYVQAFNYNVFNHKDPRNVIALFRTVRHIKRVRPDVVMTFFPTSYILGVLAARLGGVKHIVGTRRDFGLWLDRRSLPFIRFANRFVERIITNSVAVKELTAREEGFDASAIDVVYNGIDVNEINSTPPADGKLRDALVIPQGRKIVGITAGLRPMKRHRTFLLAAQRVIKVRQDVHFLLIGDGPMRSELESFAHQLGLDGHITFAGWQEDVRCCLSLFDIGVNCSANEGLSNAIMEYMACGVPCIVSAAGGNTELIENCVNGYTFTLDDDRSLAECIMGLLDDRRQRDNFIAESRNIIRRKFDLDRMVSEYERFLMNVLQGNAARWSHHLIMESEQPATPRKQ